ncbi:uncharacterized protein C5L36_0C04775 [Pichia kudriavzevii]|uniref:Uncharacterized protein n=1 Tax=Pichia kudriavzevii TaxID=4909 RepID=A0A2U9R5C3_PICKU|nr:uncharacterized protein C5L36_0C04775 [Pichia kudriavzevii]AWU76547.1 hypothetical protein C5L36_0C04775 [Pichia kudriavzevii]
MNGKAIQQEQQEQLDNADFETWSQATWKAYFNWNLCTCTIA